MARTIQTEQHGVVRTRRTRSARHARPVVPAFDDGIYRELFENANDAIALFDLQGTILLVNRGAERLLGRSREEIVGRHFREFATPTSVALAEQRTRDFLAGRKPQGSVFEIEIVRNDGVAVPVEARTRVVKDRRGKPYRFQGSYRDLTERRRMEADAQRHADAVRRERESYFQALIEHASDMIVILDRECTVQYNSPSCKDVLGYELTEATGRTGFDFVHPDDLPGVAAAFQRLLASPGGSMPMELRVRRNDGVWRVLEATGTNLLDDPYVQGIVINSRDVTDRKDSEARYRRVSELVSDYAFAFHIDTQGDVYVDWLTDNFAEVAGFPVSEFRGKPNVLDQYIHQEDLSAVLKTVKSLQPGESTEYEFRMIRADGGVRRMHSRARAGVNDAGFLTVEGASRDVTEMRESQRQQEQSAARLSEFVEQAPDVIYTLAPNATLTHLNPAFTRYTQWETEEWEGREFAPLVHPEDLPLATELFQKLLQKEEVPAFRLRIRTKTGAYRIGDFHATPQIENGEVVSILGISRDITERMHAEEELQETRRMQAMIADTVPDVICVYDTSQDRILYLNPQVVDVVGYPPQDLLGKGVSFLQGWVPEEDRQWVGQRYAQLLREVDTVEVEHGVFHRNGELRWLYSRAVVCRKTRDGAPEQILIVGQDITKRKRLEQLLQSQVIEMEEMPERLRKFRERLGMTQTEFGRQFAGVHGPYNARQISSYETGDAVIPIELVLAIRAKGFAAEGVLGVGPTGVVEKTIGYFASKRAEQAIVVQLLGVLLRLAERDRETIESALSELHLPGRVLTRSEEKLLEEVQGIAQQVK